MQHGRLFLAGDAAHTVPTGAKGMTLAIADVHVLSRALVEHVRTGSTAPLDACSTTELDRVWRAQHYSSWLTSMLHRFSDATDFDLRPTSPSSGRSPSRRTARGCWPRSTSGGPSRDSSSGPARHDADDPMPTKEGRR